MGTSQHQLVASSMARRAPVSSPGPASFSTRTMTSSVAVLSFPTTAATTMDEAQGRLSLLPTSSRMSKRMSNDVAILYTDRDINLNNPNVNTACLPSCRDQFSHQFNNGTGVRCWVAGWGKNEVDGSFQFIQHKVDLPLVENN